MSIAGFIFLPSQSEHYIATKSSKGFSCKSQGCAVPCKKRSCKYRTSLQLLKKKEFIMHENKGLNVRILIRSEIAHFPNYLHWKGGNFIWS